MQKTDLIRAAAQEAGVSQDVAAKVIGAMLDAVTTALRQGEKVTLTGFGTFEVRVTKARTGTNPRTKEKIQIPAGRRATFSAGTQLREAVSGEKREDGR
jgi:DNA-binding protein HU-beta